MSYLDWNGDGRIDPVEIGGSAWLAGAATNLADSASSGGGNNNGDDDEGGVGCGCLLAFFLIPFIVIMVLLSG